ncbi:hypothetical protein [Natronorubrum sp. FCH18a]|uniref:hypothetical protein n=1 Tax=Natronorubrum sp. FCH18a TaxID=3447018 RepID=UPI003F51AA42
MDDQRSRRLAHPALLLAVAIVSLGSVAVLAALTVHEFDLAASLTLGPRRITIGTVLAGALLVVGTIALPAYILSGWQSAGEDAARDRRP